MEAGSLDVLADDGYLETISWSNTDGVGNQGNSEILHLFAAAAPAQKFTFQAVADSFRLKSLAVAAVPEPASLALCLMGLTGMLAKRRNR